MQCHNNKKLRNGKDFDSCIMLYHRTLKVNVKLKLPLRTPTHSPTVKGGEENHSELHHFSHE